MRWPSSPTGCGSTGGASGWLMAPSGLVNKDHPLSPNYGSGGAGADEWGQHAGTPTTEGCDPAGINSRTVTEGRRMTSGTTEVNYVPPGVGLSTHYPRSFEYDAAGNVGFDGRFYYRYDGGNRLKDVYAAEWGTGSSPMMGNRRAHFDYDGFGRLVKSQHDTDADGSLSDEDSEWTPRDHLGRVMGIWRQAPTSGVCAKPYQVFAYHNTSFRGEGSDDSRGVLDAPAVRWRDTGSGDLDEMVSYLQDFRGDVRALVHPKYGVLERDRYGLTGRPEAFPAADVNFDGTVDGTDKTNFDDALKQFSNDPAKYDPRADLDRDGDVDNDDEGIFNDSSSVYAGYSGQWKLSAGAGLSPGHSGGDAGLDNRFGWRGYWYDPHLQVYHVRNRAYDPRQGQFLQTDPLGFSAGDQNLYRYANGNFSSGYDPLGLRCREVIPGRPELGFSCPVSSGPQDPCDQDSGIPVLEGDRSTWGDRLFNLSVGLGDGLSFGLTALARNGLDLNGQVDTTSGYYQAGFVAGALTTGIVSGGVAAEAALSTNAGRAAYIALQLERGLTIEGEAAIAARAAAAWASGAYTISEAGVLVPSLGGLAGGSVVVLGMRFASLPNQWPNSGNGQSRQQREECARNEETDDYLRSRGETPNERNPQEGQPGAGRQADRLNSTEYKFLRPGADVRTVLNRIRDSVDGGGQGRNLVFNATNSGLTEAQAREAIARAFGNYGPSGVRGHRLDTIRIFDAGRFDTGSVQGQ